ncbi:MAG: methionyl-tRNA formyltransferase [Aquabacterium sp.]
MRIAFAGTPPFAARALQALAAAGHEIVLVLSQPDRPAGRGLKAAASAVKLQAQALGVPVAQPRGLRLDGRWAADAAEVRAALDAAKPEVMVVAAYGLILPAWALSLPTYGCLNIHGSLLPRWRGAAPVQRAIEAGDTHTGVAIMQMDTGLDTGAVRLQQALPIDSHATAASLTDALALLGARLVVQALRELTDGHLPLTPQPLEGINYAHKIEKSEAPLDWRAEAALLERRIRAFDPFPGAHFTWAGEAIKVWRAEVVPGWGGLPGQIQRAGSEWRVACATDALRLVTVQRPGGRRAPVGQALAGLAGIEGALLPPPVATPGSTD